MFLISSGRSGNNNSRTGIIVGAAVGVSILLLLLICVGGYVLFLRKSTRKAKQQTDPFGKWLLFISM